MNAIVYKVNEKGDRNPKTQNWCGELENREGTLWLKAEDLSGNTVYLQRGDIIHYSHNDTDIDQGNYIVVDAWTGIYKVEKYS